MFSYVIFIMNYFNLCQKKKNNFSPGCVSVTGCLFRPPYGTTHRYKTKYRTKKEPMNFGMDLFGSTFTPFLPTKKCSLKPQMKKLTTVCVCF